MIFLSSFLSLFLSWIYFDVNFFVVLLQSYAEVDPGFVVKYYNELKCDWYVINDKGCSHKIGLNMDYDNPLICSGWNELKEFYCFQDDVVVEFSYFGKNLFGMRSFGKLTSTEEVPSFHSRSGNPFDTFCFDVQLTRTNFHKMDLVCSIPIIFLGWFLFSDVIQALCLFINIFLLLFFVENG
jgi:hypothetical protein